MTKLDGKATMDKETEGAMMCRHERSAEQALIKLALEPEWEEQFESNSYGFRPGRCLQDAIEPIFNYIRLKSK
jgi:RNA-directed DNA polymerase